MTESNFTIGIRYLLLQYNTYVNLIIIHCIKVFIRYKKKKKKKDLIKERNNCT